MSFTVTLSPPSSLSLSSSSSSSSSSSFFPQSQQKQKAHLKFHSLQAQASRRPISNYQSQGSGNGSGSLVDDPRNWSRRINSDLVDNGEDDEDDDDEDEEEEEEEDRSLDLLVRFVENVFRKISKRARKAVRSVLPSSISTKLVGFSVNGVLLLAFLWVVKAFLQVICTLGSVVFVSILLIRGVWAGVTYLQESHNLKVSNIDDDRHAWTGARPAG